MTDTAPTALIPVSPTRAHAWQKLLEHHPEVTPMPLDELREQLSAGSRMREFLTSLEAKLLMKEACRNAAGPVNETELDNINREAVAVLVQSVHVNNNAHNHGRQAEKRELEAHHKLLKDDIAKALQAAGIGPRAATMQVRFLEKTAVSLADDMKGTTREVDAHDGPAMLANAKAAILAGQAHRRSAAARPLTDDERDLVRSGQSIRSGNRSR